MISSQLGFPGAGSGSSSSRMADSSSQVILGAGVIWLGFVRAVNFGLGLLRLPTCIEFGGVHFLGVILERQFGVEDGHLQMRNASVV